MMRSTPLFANRIAPAVLACVLPLASHADVSLDYQYEVGAAHTNNINRTPTDGIDETAGLIGLALDLEADTRRLDASIELDLERRIYTKDTNDDETLGALDAALQFSIVEGILAWQATDAFGQVLNDIFAPDNPQNREDVNVFSTGPVLTLPFNGTNRMLISAVYRDVSYEDSPQDNDALAGEIAFVRSLNANRTFSLNLNSAAIDFDRLGDPDFDRHSASIQFSSNTSRSSLDVELGRNRVDFGTDDGERDGNIINVAFRRDLSSRLELSFAYDQQLSDSGQLFGQFVGDRTLGNSVLNASGQQDAVADAIEQRTGNLTLNLRQRYGDFTVSARLFDVDFELTDEQDRDALGFGVGYNRNLAGGWRVGLGFDTNTTEFADGREDDNWQARVTLAKQLTRTLSLDLAVLHVERDSSDSRQSFDEDAVRLTLVWQPRRERGQQ